jgi:endonuclease/exonuclease/phosphatase family metal-dependent hydrolase
MPRPIRKFAKVFLLSTNIFLAVIYIAGSYTRFFDPVHWWFIGLITMCLPYILLFLIIFLIFWLFKKPLCGLISVLAIILTWDPTQNIIPFRFTSSFTLEKKAGSIRIMSWNVEGFDILEHKKHPLVKQKMLDLIKQYQPDIACFQEMTAGEDTKAINYIGDFLKQLQFAAYHYSYSGKGDYDEHHHFGIIIFSKFPIINKQTIDEETPYNYNSIFQYADILTGSDTIRVFNIHLQSLRFTESNRRYLDNPTLKADTTITETKNIIAKLKAGFINRRKQALSVKSEINRSPYPVILCGDFNDVPNSFAYETIGKDMQNAFEKKGRGIGRTFYSIAPTLRIDNIFADNHFDILQFRKIGEKLSDHFPIITDISLH